MAMSGLLSEHHRARPHTAKLATTSWLIVSFGAPGSDYPLKSLTWQAGEETSLFPSLYSDDEPALDTNWRHSRQKSEVF
jgi:hypothetical protein